MAAYNLGVGGAVAAGPLLVAVFYPLVGATGLILIFCALFLIAAWMGTQLKGTQPGFDGVPPHHLTCLRKHHDHPPFQRHPAADR